LIITERGKYVYKILYCTYMYNNNDGTLNFIRVRFFPIINLIFELKGSWTIFFLDDDGWYLLDQERINWK